MLITVEATVEPSAEKTKDQVKSVDEDANTIDESETTNRHRWSPRQHVKTTILFDVMKGSLRTQQSKKAA